LLLLPSTVKQHTIHPASAAYGWAAAAVAVFMPMLLLLLLLSTSL
jgi:hypothetical protein